MLVLVNALDNVNLLMRRRIESYLISNNNIKILVSMCNLPEIVTLYPRHLSFQRSTFVN